MTVDNYLISLEEDTQNANVVREIVLRQLLADGHISEDLYRQYVEDWQVIILKYNWFKTLVKTVQGEKGWFYYYTKLN